MVVLCRSYFTKEIIRAIRSNEKSFDPAAWKAYREYHSARLEKINSKNAVFIMNEFRNTCETIASLPNESCIKSFLSNRYTMFV
jgi:hypothetical protein